jgi:hypothetical protein
MSGAILLSSTMRALRTIPRGRYNRPGRLPCLDRPLSGDDLPVKPGGNRRF